MGMAGLFLGALLAGFAAPFLISCHKPSRSHPSHDCTPYNAGFITPKEGGPGISYSDVSCSDSTRWRIYHAPKRIRLP